jgi:hypothetical protein
MSTRDDFDRAYEVRNDGQIHLGAINLDDMPESDLRIAADHPALHSDVKQYAYGKCSAIAYKLDGEITKAARVEARLESIYYRMPKPCRW